MDKRFLHDINCQEERVTFIDNGGTRVRILGHKVTDNKML